MAIRHTSLHAGENFDQIRRVLVQLQLQVNQNAQTHRAMAMTGNFPLSNYEQTDNKGVTQTFPGLTKMISDCIQSYLDRLKLFSNWIKSESKHAALAEHASKSQYPLSDFTHLHDDIKAGVEAFAAAPRSEYAEIVAACSQLILDVDAPEFFIPHDKSIAEAVK